jgi:hypothetical protein
MGQLFKSEEAIDSAADELLDLVAKTHDHEFEMYGHYGNGYHRKITYSRNNGFRVYDHHELVLETTSALFALEKYDSIRPK